jgi:uncharacterized SAM-binding protein YcdF (DUF218 family)
MLILCGGIGHSTSLIYDAVARHEKYRAIKDEVMGLPEARALEKIMEKFFDVEKIKSRGCLILVEDKSTNCGSNAIECRRLLEELGFPTPDKCILVQDPTMARRTLASFQKACIDLPVPPILFSCPVFVPKVRIADSELVFDVENVDSEDLWEMNRFLDLIIGEIPRLMDDAEGYGPNGKDFIVHVDIPVEVELAWVRVKNSVGRGR